MSTSHDLATILVHRHTIAAVNEAFETLVGIPACELVGKSTQVLICEPDRRAFGILLDEALACQATTGQVSVETRGGTVLELDLAFTVLSTTKDKQLLVSVAHWREKTEPGVDQLADMLYEISLSPFGLLKRAPGNAGMGSYCFEALHGRSSPCAGCPATKAARGRALSVIACDGSSSGACITVAMRIDATTVRIAALRADKELTSELLAVHADAAATRHGLTTREREVLRLALHGRSTAEIAAALRTSASTAKFHLANVCSKLGAESRVDLLRHIMQG